MDPSTFEAAASTLIAATPEQLYAFIADMPRMGEVSPECTGGTWDGDARGVGALFIGTNKAGDRTWQRRIRVTVADPPREFAWENLGDAAAPLDPDAVGAARWGYTFRAVDGGTVVDESWRLLDHPRLRELGEERLHQLRDRNRAGMEQTLARLKELVEA
ncbi:MAG TPA: SRPBCC family protein [Acidimicrobiales bacterium]|jgi:hypothetical protein